MKKEKRAPKGRGSVFERSNGRWAAVVELPPHPATGARRRRWVHAATKNAAIDLMREVERAESGLTHVGDTDTLVAPFLRRWLEDTVKPNMRPSTATSYESAVERHLIPALGKKRLRDVSPAAIQALYAAMREAGLSSRTIQKVHAVLHRALGSAVRLGLLGRNAAALGDDVPKYHAPEREPLTKHEAAELLRAARDDRFEALYVLALTTGARQGELFALRWADVDLETGVLTIRRALQDADRRGGLTSGATKTQASRRRFALPSIAIEALRRHRERQKADGNVGAGLIFTATNGKPVRRQNFLRRNFYPLLERAGLPKIHFHDLRHTAATLLASEGVPVVVVSALLGHADPTITLRTYQHAFEGGAGDAAQRLGRLFDGAAKPS